MRITILCVGKLKERFFQEAVQEYAKRLSRYCKLQIVEVADEKTPENASEKEERLIRQREGERLLKAIREDGHVIALAIDGKEPDSIQFANLIQKLGVSGISHIYFLIGGSLGLSDEVMQRADEKISFSHMTFPHQLMRVILCEQIYRGCRILNGEPYHK